ncbi:NAD(P)H-hydrate dehydratase [Pedobacter sp. KR3-3]|uniref:Bifunctional NAD(P)H-hydrate repair enzyme n=1 Tax=Pedobacter albus TaxID=3113905 RepID=A0ABU7IC88_9SPHI|nr:NAD(P)H-hydrate dehydratase [Pedobacter sp. KR3-3]MEE1947103.1 NAD(P)H-hydrate dehydratase [Pedobacter sp. KR3-3]
MKNLLSAAQMREADAYTIKQQAIPSIDLMERAAKAFVQVFMQEVTEKDTSIAIVCGPGNNGGDGLAIARLLAHEGYSNCEVFLASFSAKQSDDYLINLARLKEAKIAVTPLDEVARLRKSEATVIVDAILGSGLNKPLTGDFLALATLVSELNRKVIAVDVPTGFYAEGQLSHYNGVKAELAIAFQQPKLNFFFPESVQALARFKVVDIGLDQDFIASQSSRWKLTEPADVARLLVPRKNFSHKGTYGHALLIAGNETTMGAALLAARASLHTGAGLTTVCLPQSGLIALNTALPEVMALPRTVDLSIDVFDQFNAIAIGPGLGMETENERLLEQIIGLKRPLVIDADALNLLAKRQDILAELAPGSILTPHLKEFDRLFGPHENWWSRVATASEEAQQRKIVIVLKNQYTFVCLPDGEIHINPTGNPAMASGGMGDVLTGILTALLAQGYTVADAAVLGVYLHGATGDELAKKRAVVSASQLALQIPKTLQKILKEIK